MKRYKQGTIDFFIHPLPLAAVLLMALNDHFLKYQWPGVLTGKLSDFLGLFYFPLFVAAIIILLFRVRDRDLRLNRKILLGIIVVTDGLFIIFKVSPDVSQRFSSLFSQIFFSIEITPDPTDLVALSSSFLCYFFAKDFFDLAKAE